MKTSIAKLTVLAGLAFGLSACSGGGSGGVVSTPTPTPTPVYDTLSELIEGGQDQTYRIAGLRAPALTTTADTGIALERIGMDDGLIIEFDADGGTAGTYRIIAPDGSTATFDQSIAEETVHDDGIYSRSVSFLLDPPAGSSTGLPEHALLFMQPVVDGVGLSYVMAVNWFIGDAEDFYKAVSYMGVGGVPTQADDMPRTGAADYTIAVHGNGTGFYQSADLDGSTGSFSADFAKGSVDFAMELYGAELEYVDGEQVPTGNSSFLGDASGTGAISSTGPDFGGDLIGPDASVGGFEGAFFGPQATEMGLNWYLHSEAIDGRSFDGRGTAFGVKD